MLAPMTSIDNPLLRSMERVRAKRELERAGIVPEVEILAPVKTTAKVRAPLNDIPDHETLMGRINNALAALSRGVRWARGSILNLLV